MESLLCHDFVTFQDISYSPKGQLHAAETQLVVGCSFPDKSVPNSDSYLRSRHPRAHLLSLTDIQQVLSIIDEY
jgi:hypothetical protein